MRLFALFCLFCASGNLLAQWPASDAFALQWQVRNPYRSAGNPHYWKNKMPAPGYWQQDVHYRIRAALNDTAERIDGKMELVYYNNSPDTLRQVFFHLYQNAFQPESYLDKLFASNKVKPQWGPYEAQKLGTRVNMIACTHGSDLRQTFIRLTPWFDNTVMGMNLPFNLNPGDSMVFRLDFNTWFDRGSVRRRMKVYDVDSGYKHFNTVHWYPRISVYDRKFGWDVQQHLEHEFYGDFGTYDVELDLPAHYVNEATGTLINPEQAYADGLREKADMSRYKTPEQAKALPLLLANPRQRRIWRYHAENVHDFAWTADPTYRIMETDWEGVKCVAIAEQQHAPKWQPTADFVAFVVSTYSRDFGRYAYPKMVAADARDGMEYPMLTLDGGVWPSHQGLIAHEVGHNWFFGMVGNNETYRASLDEGFTQFLTSWCIRRYRNEFKHPNNVDDGTVYGRYLYDAMDQVDPILNTHSDDFSGALGHGGGYSHVYMKTATMLYNMEYVLGKERFSEAMKYYFNTWKIAHPYVEDFRQAVHESSKTDLVWFFDQWFETTKTADYAIKKVKQVNKDEQGYEYNITLRRKGEMVMPVDLLIQTKSGENRMVLIPNTYFRKEYVPSYESALIPVQKSVPAKDVWSGWANINREYTLKLETTSPISNVIIDPSQRLADVYQMDNRLKDRCIRLKSLYWNKSGDMHRYVWRINPDIWYNKVDRVKLGISFSGNYAMRKHRLDGFFWVNSTAALDPESPKRSGNLFSLSLDYHNRVGRLFEYNLRHEWLDGLQVAQAGISKKWAGNTAYANYRYMKRWDMRYVFGGTLRDQYGTLPGWWDDGRWGSERNASFNFGLKHDYRYVKGTGQIHLFARSSAPGSQVNYNWLGMEVINRNNLGKLDLHTRFFGQFSAQTLPFESALYASGANPEQMWHDSKFTRADWHNNFGRAQNQNLVWQQGGGLNLRGYANSLAPQNFGDSTVSLLRGNSGLSASAELDLDKLLRFAPKFTRNWLKADVYLFADAGLMRPTQASKGYPAVVMANAGVGSAWTISNLFGRRGAAPITLRFDVPIVRNITANGTPFLNKRFLVFGVNRSF